MTQSTSAQSWAAGDEDAPVPAVRKQVTVPVPAERAFEIFASKPLGWWPAHHKLVPGERIRIVFERPGGRWYEMDSDGAIEDWGTVLDWSPPHRIALSWRIDGRWRPIADEARASHIVVTFTPDGPGRCVVQLSHEQLHRHGEWAQAIHDALDGPSPGETLAQYARLVADELTSSAEAAA